MELYRYDRYYGPDQIIKIVLNAFTVDKETPCGYWIEKKHDYQKGRWISAGGTKRYAYPTKEEAMESFYQRTRRSVKYSKVALNRAEGFLRLVEKQRKSLEELKPLRTTLD